jgi:hypothetical protein
MACVKCNSPEQKEVSLELPVQSPDQSAEMKRLNVAALACTECGHIELSVNPELLARI